MSSAFADVFSRFQGARVGFGRDLFKNPEDDIFDFIFVHGVHSASGS